MSESEKGENYKSEENEDKDGPASNGVSGGDSKKSGTRYDIYVTFFSLVVPWLLNVVYLLHRS